VARRRQRLRGIDQRALLAFLDRKGGIAKSDHGRLAAERFGAGFFVLGSRLRPAAGFRSAR
jgi:hypothetical protein